MISLLKWIWKGLLEVWAALWNVLSSLVTWIVGIVIYVVDTLWDWAAEKISGFYDGISGLLEESPLDGDIYSLSPLAEHLCNVFALDVALECLLYVFSAFVMARLLRLAMIPTRAVLEVL